MEYFGIAPTLPGFAKRLLKSLPANQADEWHFDAERGALKHPSGAELTLHNMFLEYRASTVFGRGALVRKYADLALAQSQEIPALWAAAMRNVIPVVRSEFVETTTQIRSRITDASLDPVVLPMVGDLRIRLVYDFGSFVSYINGEHLRTWGKTAGQVLQQAIANLGRLERPSWVDSKHGFFRLSSPMSYAESMLQLDSVLSALPFAPHAVLMPCNRGILLAADARSEEAISAVLAEAMRCMQEEPWPMSGVLCRRATDGWEQVAPPVGAAVLSHSLMQLHLAENYAAQKDELDSLNEKTGRDVFVASFTLFGSEGCWESYCTWTEGVETMLPVTDWVAIVQEEETVDFIRVAWADVVTICGSHLQATDEKPHRFLVNTFPNADGWRSLGGWAVKD